MESILSNFSLIFDDKHLEIKTLVYQNTQIDKTVKYMTCLK